LLLLSLLPVCLEADAASTQVIYLLFRPLYNKGIRCGS
jgi:hypothetical protein